MEKKVIGNGQPVLRLVPNCGSLVGTSAANPDCRMYAQSTSGHISSQGTTPLDSRSMQIASDSAQLFPYATLRRWPAVVPQRFAKASRSSEDIGLRKDFRSIPDYHHMVTEQSTPNGEFTKWCKSADNSGMENSDADTRRANLRKLIDTWYRGNASAIARDYNPENPKPSYFSDLIRPGTTKSFAEKAARKIEDAVGLQRGQMDIPNSPLLRDESRRSRLKDELRMAIDGLDPDGTKEALIFVRNLQARKRRVRKAG